MATSEHRALVIDPPATERPAPRLFEPAPGSHGVTLEEMILGLWEDLVVEGRAGCPVCGGRIAPGSACRDCGSELA